MKLPAHKTEGVNRTKNMRFCTLASTGKELDVETGYSYFGARYYDSGLSGLFLSVEPMADKYPSISPYAYCAWNPVKLFDEYGEDVSYFDDNWRYNTTTGRLTWLNDEGGTSHQTVEMVHNEGSRTIIDNVVSFNGDITNMFDCSIVSQNIDGAIGGVMDIVSGINAASAGFILGVGITVGSEGTATPAGVAVGAALVAAGGSEIMLGLKGIASAIDNYHDNNSKHNFMKEACGLGLDFTASLLKNKQNRFHKALKGFGLSASWLIITWQKAVHPEYIGIPQGATVTYSN